MIKSTARLTDLSRPGAEQTLKGFALKLLMPFSHHRNVNVGRNEEELRISDPFSPSSHSPASANVTLNSSRVRPQPAGLLHTAGTSGSDHLPAIKPAI